jgi:hypothetical protein
MSDLIKVGDYVTHVNPELFRHFCGKVIAVENFQGRVAVVAKFDGTRAISYISMLRKLEVLDYFVLGIEDKRIRPD